MKRFFNATIIKSIGILLIVVIVGSVSYFTGKRYSSQKLTTPNSPPTKTDSVETSPSIPDSSLPVSTDSISPIQDPGITWLEKPIKLDDLDLFKGSPGSSPSTITYYQTATTAGGGQIIHATIEELGTQVVRFRKESSGKYYYLYNHSDYQTVNGPDLFDEEKNKNGIINTDHDTTYASLSAPTILTVNGIALKKISGGFNENIFYDNLVDLSIKNSSTTKTTFDKIGSTSYGDVIKKTSWSIDEQKPSRESTKTIVYVLKLVDTSVIHYVVAKDFLADDNSLIATLNEAGKDFASKKFNIGFTASSCGRGLEDQAYEQTNLTVDLTMIGRTSSGRQLYSVTSVSSELLKSAYETYKVGRDYLDSQQKVVSFEEFVAKQPLLVWQDPFGNYLVFMDKDYDALAECGKPVIYLYPTKPTEVKISIGAQIHLSEPVYHNGWSVFAYPNGQLVIDGQKYDSLYWEGQGDGMYPVITHGRVVPKDAIEQELRGDLSKLGLNKKESDDFIAFWLPKMPKTKFARLTWFGNQLMDQLAPLTITPKPDTMIRVFLDFAGQETPLTNLKPQNLSGIERRGFTVVEWGGLLINR